LLPSDLLGETAVHVLHGARELQGVVYPQQGVEMIRKADHTAAGHSIEPPRRGLARAVRIRPLDEFEMDMGPEVLALLLPEVVPLAEVGHHVVDMGGWVRNIRASPIPCGETRSHVRLK
jgi:hypothetical protein